jgi:hypothetical protein
MPNASDLYASKYLKAADLGGVPKTVVIANSTLESFENDGEHVRKLVLHFAGMKSWPVNKTNYKTLSSVWGDNSDAWHGKSIILMPTTVNVKGSQVATIHCTPLVNTPAHIVPTYTPEQLAQMQAAMDAAKGAPAKTKPASGGKPEFNDEIPHM